MLPTDMKSTTKNYLETVFSHETSDPHYQDTLPTTLQCSPISTGTRHEDAQSASIALAVLKNIENHGQITVIFTGEDYGKYYGAQSLPIKYLKTDNFINLRYEPKAQLITGSAATEDYILRSKAETEEIPTERHLKFHPFRGSVPLRLIKWVITPIQSWSWGCCCPIVKTGELTYKSPPLGRPPRKRTYLCQGSCSHSVG